MLLVLNKNPDQKLLQSASLVMKTICQNVVRKLDKKITSLSGDVSQQLPSTPLRLTLKSILACLELFPSAFKQLISSNRQNSKKKDLVTSTMEELTFLFLRRDPAIVDVCLRFQANMFKARDKSKLHYREWIRRIVANIVMYLDSVRPRVFSEN